jgi:hypothetical protein
MTNSPFYSYNANTKSFDFSPWGGIEGFLEASKAQGGGSQTLKRYVPDLSRAVDMLSISVANMPFEFVSIDSEEVIDSSVEWENVLGGIPDPQKLMYLLASSLCGGSAYLIPRRTPKMIYDLQYIAPQTVEPWIVYPGGLQYFNRSSLLGQFEKINPDKIMYFWLPDSDVEIGPALNTPLSNAMADAQLTMNIKNTMRIYGERGFVPITLLGAKGITNKDEKERAEGFFNRLLRGGFDVLAKIVNSEALSLIKVGAGMEELKGVYIEVLRQSKEDIAQAFGIPTAMFMSDNAFASEFNALARMFYMSSRMVSIYQTIEETFNTQLLKPYGAAMYFRPEGLSVFQEDESARASSLSALVTAIDKSPETAKFGMSILGYDLTEEQEQELEDLITSKQEAADKLAEDMANNTALQSGAEPVDTQTDKPMDTEVDMPTTKPKSLLPDEIKDISLWFSKAKAWNIKGKGNAVDWENKHLREEIAAPIRMKLASAENELDIVKAFEIGEVTEVVHDDSALKALAEAINNAASIKDVTPAPIYNMTMPAISLTTQMPAQGTVVVNVPEQPAPTVNVSAPNVTVTNEPAVNNVTVQPAEVKLPPAPKSATITTDAQGNRTLKVK